MNRKMKMIITWKQYTTDNYKKYYDTPPPSPYSSRADRHLFKPIYDQTMPYKINETDNLISKSTSTSTTPTTILTKNNNQPTQVTTIPTITTSTIPSSTTTTTIDPPKGYTTRLIYSKYQLQPQVFIVKPRFNSEYQPILQNGPTRARSGTIYGKLAIPELDIEHFPQVKDDFPWKVGFSYDKNVCSFGNHIGKNTISAYNNDEPSTRMNYCCVAHQKAHNDHIAMWKAQIIDKIKASDATIQDFQDKGPSGVTASPSDSDATPMGSMCYGFVTTKVETIPGNHRRILMVNMVTNNKNPTLSLHQNPYINSQTVVTKSSLSHPIIIESGFISRYGVAIARSVGNLNDSNLIPIEILNPSNNTIKLPPSTLLSQGYYLSTDYIKTIYNSDPNGPYHTNGITNTIYSPRYVNPHRRKESATTLSLYKSAKEVNKTSKSKVIPITHDSKVTMSPMPSLISDLDNTTLTYEQKLQVIEFINNSSDVFKEDSAPPGLTHLIEFEIKTGDHQPIRSRAYSLNPEKRKIAAEEIKSQLENGIIKPSTSPWSSPIVLVPKPGTIKWRLCVDYRALNAITEKDVYPLPIIRDVLEKLHDCKYFSKIDLNKAFHQVPIKESDKMKTSFVTPDGTWAYETMSMGLVNAPACFQRLMDKVLGSLNWQICMVYMDDIVIFSKEFGKHLQDLTQVVHCLRVAGLTAKMSKCELFHTQLKFLGHIIDNKGIHPDREKSIRYSSISSTNNSNRVKTILRYGTVLW